MSVRAVSRALRALGVFSLLTGVVYPLTLVVGAHVAFPHQASGSLVERAGKVVGSELIGQDWRGAVWFHGRPSAVGYDADGSGGSNLGPTSRRLALDVYARMEAVLRVERAYQGGLTKDDIPPDLVTASGSGLDPHISPEAALLQAPRVAVARGLPLAEVRELIERLIEPPLFGSWGGERVNVLDLNLGLLALARG
jgi:K+-transporting ATPase ATPase C chain